MYDIKAIEDVKYQYLWALDTRHWDAFADTLAEDVVATYGTVIDGEPLVFTNRDDLVNFMRSSLIPSVATEHRVTHPQLTVTGDEASGRWYLQDKVIAPDFNRMLIGAGFYRDEYRRTADGWKISATGYDRTYEMTFTLDSGAFEMTMGKAMATVPDLPIEVTESN